MIAFRAAARVVAQVILFCFVIAGVALGLGAGVATAAPPEIFTSLETPPTVEQVESALARGVTFFDFDLDKPGAAEAIVAIKKGGAKITAYHIGGGGGRAWGSVKTDEWVRRYDSPRDFLALTQDVKYLVSLGADYVHFDNTHRFSGRRLESIAGAIIAGGAGFIAKNNPDRWNLVMKRRADLVPAYALIEDAMFDANETQAAAELFKRGVAVYFVGFRKPIDPKVPAMTDDYAQAFATNNPWCSILVMDDERAWDSRSGVWFR